MQAAFLKTEEAKWDNERFAEMLKLLTDDELRRVRELLHRWTTTEELPAAERAELEGLYQAMGERYRDSIKTANGTCSW